MCYILYFHYSPAPYYWASLVAQWVKNPPAMQGTPVGFLGGEDRWRRDRLPNPVFLGFPCGSAVKNPPAKQETWVRSLGREDALEKGKTTQYSGYTPVFWPGEFHSLYSPWSPEGWTRLSGFHFHIFSYFFPYYVSMGYFTFNSILLYGTFCDMIRHDLNFQAWYGRSEFSWLCYMPYMCYTCVWAYSGRTIQKFPETLKIKI